MPRSGPFLLVVSLLVLGVRSTPAANVTVLGLEVTQGAQDTSNSVALVAARSTAVRVTLDTGGASVGGITGRLHLVLNGAEVTPPEGSPAVNEPFTAPASPRRENAGDTLNFVLPSSGAMALTPGLAKFKVEVSFPAAGGGTAKTSGETTPDLKVLEPLRPILYQVRMEYSPASLPAPGRSVIDPAGAKMLLAICPLSDEDPSFCQLIPGDQEQPFSYDPNHDRVIDDKDSDQLLSNLETLRQLIVKKGYGADERVYLFGWLPGDPSEYYGYARCPGKVGFGNTLDDRFQRTFAHEFCHMLGLDHNTRTINEVGWDVLGRLPGNQAKDTGHHDIMTPGLTTDSAWIDVQSYTDLLNARLTSAPGTGGMTDQVMVIRGIIQERVDPTKASKAEQRVEILPVFRYPWQSQPSPEKSGGAFQVTVIDDEQRVTHRSFDAWSAAGQPPPEEKKRLGAFSVMVSIGHAQARKVMITSANGQQTFGTLEGTPAPPVVTILSPPEGAQLGGQVLLTWKGQDADSNSEDLTYQVAFSPDEGHSFLPLSWDTKDRSLTFRTKGLPPTAGTGVIRVFASDGLNTAYKDLVGLTISGQ